MDSTAIALLQDILPSRSLFSICSVSAISARAVAGERIRHSISSARRSSAFSHWHVMDNGYRASMRKSVEAPSALHTIRTGRANPSCSTSSRVEYYGAETHLCGSLATLSTRFPRHPIQPFASVRWPELKGHRMSDLGLTPNTTARSSINIPPFDGRSPAEF